MATIKTLFDASKGLDRRIEKVITFGSNAEESLKAEISEYVVTEHLNESLHTLLELMQQAMVSSTETEIGVWVSGFYGSGKSSLTKYIGMALDDRIKIEGTPFLNHFSARISDAKTKALLNVVAKKFPASVVMVDLASEQAAGATMEDIATVLYYKTLRWAGYSRNLKIAAFERRLKKDKRFEEFELKVSEMLEGESWKTYQDDPAVVDYVIPAIAHQMYPKFWPDIDSFKTNHEDTVFTAEQQAQEIIDIVRETSGKEYCLFIFDEIGNYVGPRQGLIFKLQGFAEIIKRLGQGKVWIFGTAQQTLTEDDKSAALNSPELYKLKDRFPISLRLESSDIKEICYLRLLGKSASGEDQLRQLFNNHGQSLRHSTKLEGNKYYESDFNDTTFINLYPFLPAHFELLLNLLGVLAKSTGGIGLRSAIKVIHDVLVEGSDLQSPLADNDIGWIASSVTLYDAMESDIAVAFASKHKAVNRLNQSNWFDSKIHTGVAKTVALLEILNNLPITRANVAALMHGNVSAQSQLDEVNKAVEDLLNDSKVPLAEKDNELCFFSERLNDIEQIRNQLRLQSIELRKISNSALKDVLSPLPSTQLNNTLSIQTGVKYQNDAGTIQSLNGERNDVQTVIEFVASIDFDNARTRIIDVSRHRQNDMFLLARIDHEVDEHCNEIYRSQEIANRYRGETDKEIKEYCHAQMDRATTLTSKLQQLIKRSLFNGEFIFRGNSEAVESHSQDLFEAHKKFLGGVAKQVFYRHQEAPIRVQTDIAERFMRADNLSVITSEIDPLSLIVKEGGQFTINENHQAIVSIKDYIDNQGGVDGKTLSDHFSNSPFGWSSDTLRYIVAAMFVGSLLKFKVAGAELTSSGQKALEAIKNNNSFKNIGVNLRDDRPSIDMCLKAADRLTSLTGITVFPMEQDISKAATQFFNLAQRDFAPLIEKVKTLNIHVDERLDTLSQDLTDMLISDASDAPQRLGAEDSLVFSTLQWASEIKNAFNRGLDNTLSDLKTVISAIDALPDTGLPGQLKTDTIDYRNQYNEYVNKNDFYQHSADFSSILTSLNSIIASIVEMLSIEQSIRIQTAQKDFVKHPAWNELSIDERDMLLQPLDSLTLDVNHDLKGLQSLLTQEFNIQCQLNNIKNVIETKAQQKSAQRVAEERLKYEKEGKTKIERKVTIPKLVTQPIQLDTLIHTLIQLKGDLELNPDIEIYLDIDA
jgi:hypothetical protein